jgi:hypothetical protein
MKAEQSERRELIRYFNVRHSDGGKEQQINFNE